VVGSPITVGTNPLGVAVNPEGTTAYISNGGASTLSAIATASNTVVGSPIPTGLTPIGIGIVPAIPNAGFGFSDKRKPGKPVSFNGSNSDDLGSTLTGYRWNFGDGQVSNTTIPTVQHTYSKAGTYQVTLTVSDAAGCTNFIYTGQTPSCNPSQRDITKTVTVPSNNFSFGKLKLLPNGTAILFLHLPGPGTLTLGGNGAAVHRPGRLARAHHSKHITHAGTVRLKIKARGRARKKLRQTGKVRVKVKVTFTPTDGIARHKSRFVRLHKRH
jgi:hypothetical protein